MIKAVTTKEKLLVETRILKPDGTYSSWERQKDEFLPEALRQDAYRGLQETTERHYTPFKGGGSIRFSYLEDK